jgi:hypothetical protein
MTPRYSVVALTKKAYIYVILGESRKKSGDYVKASKK